MSISFDLDPESVHRCDACGHVLRAAQLKPIMRLLNLRVEPGGIVPSGECPDCSALAYPYGPQERHVDKKGVSCPCCGSSNTAQLGVPEVMQLDSGVVEWSAECYCCGETWIDVYKLTGFRRE
jgi:hypothetical protein